MQILLIQQIVLFSRIFNLLNLPHLHELIIFAQLAQILCLFVFMSL